MNQEQPPSSKVGTAGRCGVPHGGEAPTTSSQRYGCSYSRVCLPPALLVPYSMRIPAWCRTSNSHGISQLPPKKKSSPPSPDSLSQGWGVIKFEIDLHSAQCTSARISGLFPALRSPNSSSSWKTSCFHLFAH